MVTKQVGLRDLEREYGNTDDVCVKNLPRVAGRIIKATLGRFGWRE
jgi:hypothetical protein